MISKRGTVTIADGILTVTGYEFSELTWTQDAYRSAVIQALDDVDQIIASKRIEMSSNIDVSKATQEKNITSSSIVAKGKPIPDVQAVVAADVPADIKG